MRSSSSPDGATAPSDPRTSPAPVPDARLLGGDEDQDTGDLPTGVDEDALNDDPLDTDQIAASE